MSDFAVAQAILDKMGGHSFLAITGAYSLVAGKYSLSFRLPGSVSRRVRYVVVTLGSDNLYSMEFFTSKLRSLKMEHDIYAHMLQEVFTRNTGLATRNKFS